MADILLVDLEANILGLLHDKAKEYSKSSTFTRSAILENTEMTVEQFQKAMSFLVQHKLAGIEPFNTNEETEDFGVWITADGANAIRHYRRNRGERA